MKTEILEIITQHKFNHISSEQALSELLDLFAVVGSDLLYDLMKEQQEIISSPIRFNGVHIEKIKQVFEKNGIKCDVGF